MIKGSKLAILIICCSWWFSATKYEIFKKNHVINDVISYYAYLPATLVYHDLSLKFTDSKPAFFGDKLWPLPVSGGGRLIKTSMGLSVMLAPFFCIGHLLAPHFGYPADGFSAPYQTACIVGVFVYLLIGFLFLRKLLLRFYSETGVFITLMSLFLGTNLFYYSAITPLMAHSVLFSLCCVFMYYTVVLHESPTFKRALALGLVAGLMTLIRPTMIIILIFPLFYKIYNLTSLKEKFTFFTTNWKVLIVFAIFFVLPVIPQLFYWKYITGHWVFFSYVGERFFFARPHIAEGLYSYQKGWLVYTPIMTFSVLGFVALWKYVKESFLAVFLSFAVFVYVLMSWWTWWYGGSFGQRVFIDFYPLLALPFGAFFHFIQRRHLRIQDFTYYIAGVLIFWNLFQTWEYNEGLLHYDSMTEEAYWRGFFQTKSSTQYWQSLKPPNSYAAIRGIHEKFVGVEGFEQETTPDSALKQLNYSQHREGKSSFTVNEAFPSTEPLVISMSYLLDRRGQGLRISVYVYMPEAFKQEDQEQASLLTSVEGPDGKIIVSKVIQLYGKCKKGTWTQVKDDLPISESFRNANVKISVRNSSKEKILVDDLQVEIR